MTARNSRKAQLRRALTFKEFVAAHPPQMPAEFTHAEWLRVVRYAKCAFITGWNSGINDRRVHGRNG